ncbi:MAG TPA: hypothetical protein VI861_01200 [Rickettsiales bacterium]|nr:hypothetical protein [Rickettsiales bacterium]
MNLVSALIKNPFIKILAVIIVFYFGFYQHKEDPESLGNRLSKEKIKNNFQDIKDRTHFIVSNVKIAQEYRKYDRTQKLPQHEIEKIDLMQYEDEKEGEGELVKCGDEVEISYGVYDKNTNNTIEFIENKKIIVNSNENIFFERKVIGMKKNGVRSIVIPKAFKTEEREINSFLRYSEADLLYRINIINFIAKNNCS